MNSCIRKPIGVVVFLLPLTVAGQSRLIESVKNRDQEAIREILKIHVDVNATQEDGATALHWAVHWDDMETADLLIRAGANPNAADDLGVTPLALACINRSSTMVSRLLAAGGNPNAASSNGESVLMACSRSGNAGGVKVLLARGANVNAKERLRDQTALMWAVSRRHPEVVQILLENGADFRSRTKVSRQLVVRDDEGSRLICPPDATEEYRHKSSYKIEAVNGASEVPDVICERTDTAEKGGSTALLFAARVGDLASARLLVAAGADVNDAAPDGNSALVLAAYSGHGDVAEFLLGKDANPNATGAGYTALHAAVLRGDLGLVTALLAHGANPNVHLTKGTPVLHQNVDLHLREALLGATPFFLAAKFLEGDMMRALVAAGADARLGVKDGTTPLMAATGVGWKGGSVTRRDTVSFFAAVRPDEDRVLAAVKLMLDLGADVNASNQNGDTALHGAASHGYTAVTQLLVDHGAKLDVKNKRGQAPSDIAPKKR